MKWLWLILAVIVLLAAAAIAGGAIWALRVYNSAPALSRLHPRKQARVTKVYAADGSQLGVIHSDTIREPVPGNRITPWLKTATVAIEDKNFFNEGGIDLGAIVRAGWRDLRAGGKPLQGASTITQQLVRNLYITHPRETIRRKLIEAHLANEENAGHSKDWILTKYLNTAPYGTNGGATAIGVQAAAETYFSRSASRLTLRQAALLAGLPQAPSQYNPLLHPRAALARRNEVLQALLKQRYITPRQYRRTVRRGLGLVPSRRYTRIRQPYIFNFVQRELIERYGRNTVRNGGLKVYTTIRPRLQDAAQQAVDACSVCYPGGGPASALASVDPKTGEIVALASSQHYSSNTQFNFAAQAHRQPGSSFKTFVLTTAIKQGVDPNSTYYDGSSPKTLQLPGGGAPWTVNNAEPGKGTMSLTEATINSVNAVFAQLVLDVGPQNFADTAYSMGITSPLGINAHGHPCKHGASCYVPPADAIGGLSEGVTPLEMADAYATLANGGVHHRPTAIAKVVFPDGHVDRPSQASGERVLTPGEAYDVTRILEGVITKGTGAGFTSIGCSSEAGKTGTTDGLSDAWFVGYTPLFSTAVWTGHPLSRSFTGFGGPTSGPIWRSYMEAAQGHDCPDFPVPTQLPLLSPLRGGRTSSRLASPSPTPGLGGTGLAPQGVPTPTPAASPKPGH
ncbi:MAG TPA: transglycosylase domain-containing protein [Solirubrobacteraceae bacterium]